MRAIAVAGLLIYTFGAFAYGALAMIWLRAWRGRRRLGADAAEAAGAFEGHLIFGALIGVSVVWFLSNITMLLLRFARISSGWPLDVAVICLACTYPPIIMHSEYVEARGRRGSLGRGWRIALYLSYAVACALPAWSFIVFMGPSTLLRAGTATDAAKRVAEQALGVGMSLLFVAAAAYSIALGARRGATRTVREGQAQRWSTSLFGLMILLFTIILVRGLSSGVERPALLLGGLVEVAAKSLPLVFFFAASYHENRFEFFDLFVKRGVFLVVTIAMLTAWAALCLPLLQRLGANPAAPWLYAIVLLPVAASLPWTFARLGALVDRRWLGRRFSTVDAVTHFFGRLRSARSEAQIVQQAEAGLHDIFDAPAVVRVGPDGANVESIVQEIPIRSGDAVIGRVLMGQRRSEAPYFSQDLALLSSLADVLAQVLDNLRLQLRDQEQDRRARDLSLQASRSELKALRAQINPHFLFNALNSIAGLIHRQPAAADRTIEQLAEVFRYALRDADSEWAILDDELEFVRAYLAVERARFGARLETDVSVEAGARGARLPTMIVQTLVENAVKHGVASVRGEAIVRVGARVDGDDLVVAVTDNGPGFHDEQVSAGRDGAGYGLANIRLRLDGYFGARATLDIRRDVDRGHTIVSVSLPLLRRDPSAARGSNADPIESPALSSSPRSELRQQDRLTTDV